MVASTLEIRYEENFSSASVGIVFGGLCCMCDWL